MVRPATRVIPSKWNKSVFSSVSFLVKAINREIVCRVYWLANLAFSPYKVQSYTLFRRKTNGIILFRSPPPAGGLQGGGRFWFPGAKRLVFRCETLGFPARNARLQMGGTFLKCFRGKDPDDSFAKPILEISCFKWNFFSEFPAIFFLKSFAISLFLNTFVAGI